MTIADEKTIRVIGSYVLAKEALGKDPTLDPKALGQVQLIGFNINRQEAIRTGYIDSRANEVEHVVYAFSKLRPALDRLGVCRFPSIVEFDHILSEEEAAKLIADNMALYDEVLAVSRAENEKRKAKESTARGETKENKIALLMQNLLAKNSTVSCETYEACEACEACTKRKSCLVRRAWLSCAKGLCETKLSLERKTP
jgi:hypothetical protein